MFPLSHDRPINEKGVRAFLLWSFLTKRDSLIYPKFVEVRDSFAVDDFAAALGTVPQLSEVNYDVEDPIFDQFTDYRVDWHNRLFKLRVSVSRSMFDFDLTGQTRQLLNAISARVANFPDKLFIDRLTVADEYESYDSSRNGAATTYYFDTTHDLGNGTDQSNLISGNTTTAYVTTTAPQTVALQLQSDFNQVVATFRSFVDDKGQPWHPTNFAPGRLIILCSPLLAIPFQIAFGADLINQTTNMFRDMVEIVSTPYLPTSGASAADWYCFYIGPNTNRPFLYSRFRRIRDEQIEDYMSITNSDGTGMADAEVMAALQEWSSVEIQTNLNSRGTNNEADVILNDRYLLGARWMGEMVPTIWQNAIKVDNAAS